MKNENNIPASVKSAIAMSLMEWKKAMKSSANIADCEIKHGCVMELEGPAIFETAARMDGVSLREFGNNRNWDFSAKDAGFGIAAHAAAAAWKNRPASEIEADDAEWLDYEIALAWAEEMWGAM